MLQVHLLAIWNLEHVFPLKQEGTRARLTHHVLHCNTTKQFFTLFLRGVQTQMPAVDDGTEESGQEDTDW